MSHERVSRDRQWRICSPSRASARRTGGSGSAAADRLLLLQRTAGNGAVARMIQRQANVTGHFIGKTPSEGQGITASGSTLISAFSVEAELKPVPAGQGTDEEQKRKVQSGEYRQFVRGAFVQGGVDQQHTLNGDNPGDMDRVIWREDVLGGKQYGRRRRGRGNNAPQAYYKDAGFQTKDNAYGPFYRMYDTPGGTQQDDSVLLEFEGRLVDTRDNGNVVATRHWTVTGSKI